jgi:putative two-component system response regulator
MHTNTQTRETREERVIHEHSFIIDQPPQTFEELLGHYNNLLNHYRRLQNHLTKVTKKSDRQEAQLIAAKEYSDQLRHQLEDEDERLRIRVNDQTRELEQTTKALVTALENVNEINDEDTGNHIRRVAEYSALLAQKLGCSSDMIKNIKLFAPLHDVGKYGIAHSILKKPGRLTPEEFETMKQHVHLGFVMLDQEGVHEIAKNIVLYHHEKWNGQGYLAGLSGTDIPLEARIVALADVYDALTQKRVYKEAFSEEKSRQIIIGDSGTHFDPAVVQAYQELMDDFLEIRMTLV